MDETAALLLSRRARSASTSVIRDLLHLLEQPGILSLAGGLPAAEAFPVERLRQAADRVLGAGGTYGTYGTAALQYGPTEGVAGLREWVASQLPRTDPAGVLITTGSQQGLDLLFHALVDPGDAVVVEARSYLGALQAMEATEPTVVAIPIDGEGLRVDLLAERLRAGLRPRCCYVVANFSNPSGATLSLERRRELAALADRYGFVVIEDDPYGALRFRGKAIPPIRTFTSSAVTLGTVSKVLAPGLRVGWLAAPPWLLGPLVRLKQARDLHTSTLAQHVALDVLTDERFMAAHLQTLPGLYRRRCDALSAALVESFGDGFVGQRPDGGMFLWGRLPGVDTQALLPRAVEAGVAFVPGSAFHCDHAEGDNGARTREGSEHLRLSFATLDPEQLSEAARRLANATALAAP